MRFSHSKVDTFNQCAYKFKLRYIDELKTIPEYDPASPLVLGSALHLGIEKDLKSAIKYYYSQYPIITDAHVTEAMKLEYWIPKLKKLLPEGEHEVKLEGKNFLGFIDLLVPVGDNEYDLYDFKYSNNVDNYMDSEQLHLYKAVYETAHPGSKIRDMYFVFVPKSFLKQKRKNKRNKRDETLREYRQRIMEDLKSKEIKFIKINFDESKVYKFLEDCESLQNCTNYEKTPTRLCDWCEYQGLCEKGDNIMILPSTERVSHSDNGYKKIWFYGLPFSGKTYLANQFETPLMLNTDGNFKQVDAPVLRIVDEVTTEGRITKRKYAWEVFQDAVAELEKKENDFETIVVDLLEDVYDACRIKVCHDNGWDHESDDSFKAYDIVRSDFLRTLKRLINLPYNIVLISHEDTSRDITKKTGDKVTAIKPNLAEKLALKVAGMVDICCRITNDDGKRLIKFKSNEVEFGGGRLAINVKEIPSSYEELMKVYNDKPKDEISKVDTGTGTIVGETAEERKAMETATAEPEATTETPERKTRTKKPEEVVEDAKEEVRTRRRRTREGE